MKLFLSILILISSSLFAYDYEKSLVILPFNGVKNNDNVSLIEMFSENISKTTSIKVINSTFYNYSSLLYSKFDSLNVKEYYETIMNIANESKANYVLFGYISKLYDKKKLNIKVLNMNNNNYIYNYSLEFRYIENIENYIHIIYSDIVSSLFNDQSTSY